MATAVMPPAPRKQAADAPPARSIVDALIDRARSAPAPARGALALSVSTAVLLWAAFTPLDWGPLGWVCLVPLMQLIRLERPTRWMYRMIYLGGLVFALATLQWMRLGDLWMYPAWIALALYVAFYFPLFVGISRTAVHRLHVPFALAVPVVWVGLEFVRAHFLSGFAWYFLGHTQHGWTLLIQISDLFGAYGVSFLVAMGNATVAGMIGSRWLARCRLLPTDGAAAGAGAPERSVPGDWRRMNSVAALLALLAATLVYGVARRAQARFDAGPRVALIQGNFPSSLKHDPLAWEQMYLTHRNLTGRAVLERPEIIIWPETMFTWPVLDLADGLDPEEFATRHPEMAQLPAVDRETRLALQTLAEDSGASLIMGLEAVSASAEGARRYNSALLVDPERGVAGRYDKIHRVPFGEYIPLADSFDWVRELFPFAQAVGIAAGDNVHVFNVAGRRLVPVICFEDTVPHLTADMVSTAEAGGRPVDCIVNLTNDGWFTGSSEQEQHLITAQFRCVETRTAMVRAVNTGISAFIDGDGLVRDPDVFIALDGDRSTYRDPGSGDLPDEINCALIGHIPIDNRGSLYAGWGDWFAGLCAIGCLLVFVLQFSRPKRLPAGTADS